MFFYFFLIYFRALATSTFQFGKTYLRHDVDKVRFGVSGKLTVENGLSLQHGKLMLGPLIPQ